MLRIHLKLVKQVLLMSSSVFLFSRKFRLILRKFVLFSSGEALYHSDNTQMGRSCFGRSAQNPMIKQNRQIRPEPTPTVW